MKPKIDTRLLKRNLPCALPFSYTVVSGGIGSNCYYKNAVNSLVFDSALLTYMDSFGRNGNLVGPMASGGSPWNIYVEDAELKERQLQGVDLDIEQDPGFTKADHLMSLIGLADESTCPGANVRGWIVLFADNSEWEDDVRWEDSIPTTNAYSTTNFKRN